nr:unnamed protein product [Callosobruchus analis]
MSGAVYQPTTVTYESNGASERWQDRPISYLTTSVTQAARRPCWNLASCMPSRNVLPIILISTCVGCFSLGLVLLINGAIGYAEPSDAQEDTNLILTVFGAVFLSLSVLLFACFLRATRRLCWRRRAVKESSPGGASAPGDLQAATNPSTDLLVAAQYAPVPEVATNGGAYNAAAGNGIDEEERKRLMNEQENHKEITNEDADRMVESDPRIVLRPLNSSAQEEA